MTRQAAGCLFSAPCDHVLLVQPSYKLHWDLPGGVVELGESPKAAARREVKEELGLTIEPGRLLVVDYLPANDHRPEMVAYIFDGGRIDDAAAISVDGTEIVDWAWCGHGTRVLAPRSAPILRRRIEHAITAQRDGSCVYLESGWMT